MNISASQSQLLRQLNIKPLQARAGFFPESVASGAESLAVTPAELLKPDDTVLSADIKFLLVHSDISNWLLDPAATQCALKNNNSLLITPTLAALQQPELKQQLWLLIQQQLTDYAD